MRGKAVSVNWIAHASDVGLHDYAWAVGRAQGDFGVRGRPRWVLAWGWWAGVPLLPDSDLDFCENGLSWHPTAGAALAALRRAADCREGDDRDALLRLISEVEATV